MKKSSIFATQFDIKYLKKNYNLLSNAYDSTIS